ncbi:MAG: efflux RND transporter periplasmic adaptor subunit [Stigonema ocellatum SAG 48.90 = DSM 106950]|uniref:efflux RND transporter periplasmic adaptor subunit n=1 Tax=Spirosoma sp. TaxID=1899569 RepID=UPI002624070F|nr:efflux RND transporter periplasmic adaptor subunit [Spirosoma sp.]MBR8837116.1 efflux RND transporter periplasmic adaptor subunit [Stigonema ocellatum SAG 48.90 = DSM 106950]MCX6213867.1 efflux RND transporter periplasmic adaptor subunit [Spirosoma sp.]
MKNIRYYGLLLVSMTVLLPACSLDESKKKTTEEPSEATNQAAYQLVPVSVESVAKQLSLPGEFLPFYDVALFAKVNGFIKRMPVDVGDKVHRGQQLAVMEAPELESDLSRTLSDLTAARGRLAISQSNYRRLIQAAKTAGAVAPQELDQALAIVMGDSANLTSQQQRVASARQIKQYLQLTAPFDGVVTERVLSPGALVGPTQKDAQPILKLKEIGRLRLQVTVPEVYAGQIRQNTPVTYSVSAFPGKVFTGKINRISYNVERSVRAELIEIEVKNPGLQLMPGMYATVGFPVQRQSKSLYVPKSAVVVSMEGSYVITVVNGKTHWVTVQTGNESNNQIEVIGNLKATDQVVVKGSDDIRDNMAIQTVASSSAEVSAR